MKRRRSVGLSRRLRDREDDVAADESGERGRLVQQIERGEMAAAADIVAPAVAQPEQDPGVGSDRWLLS
jgi:hypothetical protein